MCDEAIASGGKDTWFNPVNHDFSGGAVINVLYGDGSVAGQSGDEYWFGDCYGLHRVDSVTFPAWYMPYIRMDPFPYR